MRMLITSDWHPDAVTSGMRRCDDVAAAIDETVDVAIAEAVDLYAFLGDLVDPDSGSVVFRALQVAINSSRRLFESHIPNIWIAGNHDVIEDGSGRTVLAPIRAAGHAHLVVEHRPAFVVLPSGERVVCLPYPSRVSRYDPDAALRDICKVQYPQVFAVLGHLMVSGAEMGSESREMARGADVAFPERACAEFEIPFMANGHYHKRQVVRGITIPGSLERLRHDEEKNEPGFLIVEIDSCLPVKSEPELKSVPARRRARSSP